MDSKQEIILLKKALERQKKARIQAEKILEIKSKELYDTSFHLNQANHKLESLLNKKTAALNGSFLDIIDPYVIMDLKANVINMNLSAKEFLGYDHTKEPINLTQLVHIDYLDYTKESFQILIEAGTIKNYRAKIILKNKEERYVQINSSLIYDQDRKPIAAQGIIRDISQETEIKHLLAEQKKQLNIIVENSPLGIALTVKGKIIKANPSFCNLLGYSTNELKNQTIKDISEPVDSLDSTDKLHKMNDGEIDNFSCIRKYLRKDGSHMYAKTHVSAVRNNHNEVEFQVTTIEDITKEMKAEEKLKASENRLSTLILNLQTGVLLENEDRKISLTNQLFCDLFQIPASPEQLVGADCVDAAEQNKSLFKNPNSFVERIEKILSDQVMVVSDELEMVDGRILERDYIPIFNNGEYKGHLWTYQDVTLSRNYNRTLEAQREKYSSIIANMNLGLIEVDNDDIIQMVNQSFCQMSSYSEQELLGKKAKDILNITDNDIIDKKNKKRLEGKSDSYEIEIKDKNGSLKHWMISGAPRYNESGAIIGSIGIHLDITEQKLLELEKVELVKELENSNKGLQEYAHIVSHDLKSPLRSIMALSTWMQEDYRDVLDEAGQKNLQLMQDKIELMDNLISGILEYSTANSSNLVNSDIDLNCVVSDITDSIYIPEHVTVAVPVKLPTVLADKTKIHQLFQNIIGNAVVHIEKEKGLVEVLCSENENYWQFTIKDNGVGIPEKYHTKIFEIFQSVGTNERSSGIGLSIVKKIVDRYNGRVWVDSKVGIGTNFHFTLQKIKNKQPVT